MHLVYANADVTFSSFTTTIATSKPPNNPDNKLLFFVNDLHRNL